MEKELLCKTLDDIRKQVDEVGEGRMFEYVINWHQDDINAKAQKDVIEYLNKLGVVRIEGGVVLKSQKLTFRLQPRKKFDNFYRLNCNFATASTDELQQKIKLIIDERKGIYRADNPKLHYGIYGDRRRFLINLYNGNPIHSGTVGKTIQNISRDIADVNQRCKKNLNIENKVVNHLADNYFLNEDQYTFELKLSTN